ncbi:MAG TPA: VanW family protein [Armatimonadota bacterium]|nr:VanW family protein [Armatimonadota bacterium]
MDWIRKINRRYITVCLIPLVIVGCVIYSYSQEEWYSYKPEIRLPEVLYAMDIAPDEDDSLIEAIFSPNTDSLLQFLQGYPFPISPKRGVLGNRSNPMSRWYDWRSFPYKLAQYEIDLRSDPDEMVNIELASEAINGVVVRPYEVFSFNSVVGERSYERGFREGLMFSNGEVISGLGGGVCIVSTALYNTALKTGCKIIERFHHSGPVRYAGPGLDAAVVYGVMDMAFKNDTMSPLLIRSEVIDNRLTVSMYGRKKADFDVEIVASELEELPYKIIETEDPEVPEGEVVVKVPARKGYEVTITRIFKQNGKVIKREVVSQDRINPRDKIVLIPPKPQEIDEKKVAEVDAAKPGKVKVQAIKAGSTDTDMAVTDVDKNAVPQTKGLDDQKIDGNSEEPASSDLTIEVDLGVNP